MASETSLEILIEKMISKNPRDNSFLYKISSNTNEIKRQIFFQKDSLLREFNYLLNETKKNKEGEFEISIILKNPENIQITLDRKVRSIIEDIPVPFTQEEYLLLTAWIKSEI
jgi:hypothetical protein